MNSDPFYADGLRFACTQCSRCCRHDSGFVFLSENDLEAISRELGLTREEVIQGYCMWVPMGWDAQLSLREQRNNDCIFWQDGGCSIYASRPVQCRTYPFWQHILEEEDSWRREAAECPGIGVGPRHSMESIDERLKERIHNLPVRRGS